MTKIEVSLEWNEHRRQWEMFREPDRFFLYNFYDCENMRKFFNLSDKSKRYFQTIFTENTGEELSRPHGEV